MSDFITKCLIGEAFLDDVDDHIDDWHDSDSDLSIHEFLGMTHAEYLLWIKDPDCLPRIVIAHRQHAELTEIQGGQGTLSIAARSEYNNVDGNLIEWLIDRGLWE